MSEIEMKKNEIKLTANGVPLLTSSLELTSTAATLATDNPAGTVNLTQPLGGSIKLEATGLTATSGVSELKLDIAAGVVLKGGPTSELTITPAQLVASAGSSQLSLTGAQVVLEGPENGSSIVMFGQQIMIEGGLILLG
jgi:type VI secretion system secreted protein VgrG